MTQLARWSIVVALLALALACGGAAARLLEASSTLPEYTDAERAESLFRSYPASATKRAQVEDEYFALHTDKWSLRHRAEGRIALAASLLVAALAAGIVTGPATTPLPRPRQAAHTSLAVARISCPNPGAFWFYTRAVDEDHCCLGGRTHRSYRWGA